MSVPALLGIQFALMHYVEIRRWQDWRKPNSVNQDPIFSNNSLPDHEPGYPGGIFAPVIPGDLEVLKVKEIKNGRLAMVAVVGFFAQYHATGKVSYRAGAGYSTAVARRRVVPREGDLLPCCAAGPPGLPGCAPRRPRQHHGAQLPQPVDRGCLAGLFDVRAGLPPVVQGLHGLAPPPSLSPLPRGAPIAC